MPSPKQANECGSPKVNEVMQRTNPKQLQSQDTIEAADQSESKRTRTNRRIPLSNKAESNESRLSQPKNTAERAEMK